MCQPQFRAAQLQLAVTGEAALRDMLPHLCHWLPAHAPVVKPILLTLALSSQQLQKVLFALLLSSPLEAAWAGMAAELCIHKDIALRHEFALQLRAFVFDRLVSFTRTDALLRLAPYLRAVSRTLEADARPIEVDIVHCALIVKRMARPESAKPFTDLLARLLCILFKRASNFDALFTSLFAEVQHCICFRCLPTRCRSSTLLRLPSAPLRPSASS